MEHLAILFIVLGTMMGIAAIIRSFAVYHVYQDRYLKYLVLYVVLAWAGNTTRLVISYLDFNTSLISRWMQTISTITESALTLAAVMLLIASIRLLISKPMRTVWPLFLACVTALILVVSYNALGRAIGFAPAPRLLLFGLQVVLFGFYLSIAAIVFQAGFSGPRLRRIALKGLSIFVGLRPSLDFILHIAHSYASLPYYHFLILQYLVEFLTYLLIFSFIQKFAMIFSAPEPILSGQLALNNDALNLYSISEREKQVIELVVVGLSNKEIGDKLFISVRTVKDHIYNIYQKTEVKNRVQLSNLFRER